MRISLRCKDVLLLSLSAAVLYVGYQTGQLVKHLETSTTELAATIHEARATIRTTRAAVDDVRGTLIVVKNAAQGEQEYYHQTAKQTAATVRAVRQLVDRTDRQLNDALLPQATQQVAALAPAIQNLSPAIQNLSLAGANLAALEQNVSARVADPSVSNTQHQLETTAVNMAKASESFKQAMGDVQQKVHEATRPASLAKRIVIVGLDVTYKIVSIVGVLF